MWLGRLVALDGPLETWPTDQFFLCNTLDTCPSKSGVTPVLGFGFHTGFAPPRSLAPQVEHTDPPFWLLCFPWYPLVGTSQETQWWSSSGAKKQGLLATEGVETANTEGEQD